MDRFNGFLRRESAKKDFDVTVEPITEITMKNQCRQWKPISLRRPFLSAVILVTLGLLALVQFLVVYDQRHDGIMFASDISELGAGHVFLYRYFPTILSVSYGLIWHWVDVDTRRIEPYRQLSKPGGATGHNSLHLHYPTDLLAFVPLKALKRKHWPVVLSSSALVMIGMGLTPLQAAMFATESVTKSFYEPMQVSQGYMSLEDQAAQVTANYTYSVANIVWLDERLPPFMSREAAFKPFKPGNGQDSHDNEMWTSETVSFGIDVKCEQAASGNSGKVWTSSQGCEVPLSFGPDGMGVMGTDSSGDEIKQYTPFFAGFEGGGNVNYYLSSYCPTKAANVFMVALQKNKKSAQDPPGDVTRLFCETVYYQQDATVTVHRAGGNVSKAVSHGDKIQLPSSIFNTSIFQEQISSGQQQKRLRGAIPSYLWPDQKPKLSKLPITLNAYVEMSNIFGLAVGSFPRTFEDYMDPQVLAEAFQGAHRLLFARAMVDVLAADYKDTIQSEGTRVYDTEAVRVVPRFAYAVEAVLGAAALMAVALMAVSWSDRINLATDPDSLSALMNLVKGQPGLLDQFSEHDQSSWHLLETSTSNSTYILEKPFGTGEGTLQLKDPSTGTHSSLPRTSEEDKPDFQYPLEFSTIIGTLFVLALIAALAAISYLYQAARTHGLAIPSENQFVRQILQNYIPTIVATLIEPLWIVLNRLFCFFQPFEELHGREVTPQRSIDLKYSSHPPQFVIFKALGARHFILSAVCAMALLANVLAVAFSGLLSEDTISVAHSANATLLFDARLRERISNTPVSDNPYPFYHMMANFTSDTPIPQWTGDSAFYLPVSHDAQLNQSDQVKLDNAVSIESDLQCNQIGRDRGSSWSLSGQSLGFNSSSKDWTRKANLTLSLPNDGNDPVTCSNRTVYLARDYYEPWHCSSQQIVAFEYLASLAANPGIDSPDNDACHGLFLGMWARKPASELCRDDGGSFTLSGDDALVMVCKPNIVTRPVNVTMTGDHYMLGKRAEGHPNDFAGSAKLLEEATTALWTPSGAGVQSEGTWHNDSFPSDWHSYVMNLLDPNAGTLDPTLPIPDFNQTADLFTKAFRQVFAVWMGIDYERLLIEAGEKEQVVGATIMRPEIRIVVSRPMVILASTILGLYIIVAVAVYLHRPGRFLPRMPLTMASDIALFAASKAVGEPTMADPSRHDLGMQRGRFGYGRFIGTDGKPHIGIEKVPFVVPV